MKRVSTPEHSWAAIKGEYRKPSAAVRPFEIRLTSDCDPELYQTRVLTKSGHFSFIVPPGSYRLSGTIVAASNTEAMDFIYPSQQIILQAPHSIQRLALEPRRKTECTDGAEKTEDLKRCDTGRQLKVIPSLTKGPFSKALVQADYQSPESAQLQGRQGLYALQELERHKTPIVFVHGLLDSPRCFSGVLAQLNLEHFQPWFYQYPSGMSLREAGDYLASCLTGLAVEHGIQEVYVCAHSMGGLLARHAINCLGDSPTAPLRVSCFISVSTPWGGHEAARIGRIFYPPMRASWIDVATGSDFLETLLREPLPETCEHHLFFSHKRARQSWLKIKGLPGRFNHDGFVTLTSQLRTEAQEQASRVMGIDADHRGILFSPTFLHEFRHCLPGDRLRETGLSARA